MRLLAAALSLLLAPTAARAAALWSVNGATVTTAPSDQVMGSGFLETAPDGVGGEYAVWADSRNFATTGINVYATHLDSNGNPVAGWPVNGLQITTTNTGTCTQAVGARNAICPAVLGDGTGGALIVWQDWRGGTPQAYAQRMTPGGAALWTANGVLVATSPGGSDESGGPFVADNGALFVVYYDSAPLAQGGLNWRVQKLNPADGSQLFGPQGIVITSTTLQSFQYLANPVSDGANGFIATWSDKRSGTIKPRTLRVDPNGNKLWEIVLSSAANDQGFVINDVGDGSGGMYAVWMDSRAGGGQIDLYGTHILNTGAPVAGWSTGTQGGNPIAVGAPASKFLPFAENYAGDLVTVWSDLSGAHMRALAQRIGATTGLPLWTANGVPVFVPASAASDSLEAPVVRVSSGNIFVGMGWLANSSSGGCPLCVNEYPIGQAINPANGGPMFSLSTGVTLGTMEFNLFGGGSYRAFGAVASTGDATAIITWLAGSIGNTNIYAQKLSTAGASGGGGGGGGAAAPTGVQFSAVSTGSVSLSWNLVSGSTYLMVLSTQASFASTVSSGTGALNQNTTSYANLPPATYFFEVKVATNPDSAYSAAISTVVTGPPPPPAPTNVAATQDVYNTISLQWDLAAGSTYLMALAADAGFSTVLSSGLGALNQNTTAYAGLSALTSYYFKVKVSTNPDASYSAPLAVFVPAPPRPQNVMFTAVSTTSLSLSWTLENGASYVMVLSTQSSFASTVSSGTGALNQNTTTYAISQPGTYYFEVKRSTHPDAGYSAPISTTTGQPPGFTQATPISAAAGGTVSLNPVTGPINFSIPPYAFGAADNTLTSSIPTAVPPASKGASGSVTPVGPAFDIKLANPVPSFPKPVKVDVTYAAPPAVNPSLLRLAWYDDYFGVWWPIWESYYNAVLGILTAYLTHNTTFAVVTVQSAASLDQLKVFPNPVNFGAAVRNTVKFSGLTSQAEIRIYDLAGQRVADIPPHTSSAGTVNDGVSGTAEWNGRNENGNQVARGTYLYVITDPAGGKRTGMIGVVR